jgi:hypothetical protein
MNMLLSLAGLHETIHIAVYFKYTYVLTYFCLWFRVGLSVRFICLVVWEFRRYLNGAHSTWPLLWHWGRASPCTSASVATSLVYLILPLVLCSSTWLSGETKICCLHYFYKSFCSNLCIALTFPPAIFMSSLVYWWTLGAKYSLVMWEFRANIWFVNGFTH